MIQIIGWTILHSLWQITLIALLYWLAKNSWKLKTAIKQYYLAISTFLLAFVMPIATFYFLYKEQIQTKTFGNLAPSISNTSTPTTLIESSNTLLLNNQNHFDYLSFIFPWLVAFWGLGVCCFSIRFLLSFRAVNRLQNIDNEIISPEWQTKIMAFQQQFKIKKEVFVYLSKQVKEPLTFGHFKPIILLPISLVTGFDTAAIETIILHELAHIKRHDYLVNLGQSIIEIILFYHPLIWWLSKEIRELREHCCDDLVLSMGNNRITYVETLTALQWRKIGDASNRLTLTASGEDSGFSNRIKRMFGVEEKGFSYNRLMVLFGLFLLLAAGGIWVNQQIQKEEAHSNKKPLTFLVDEKTTKKDLANWAEKLGKRNIYFDYSESVFDKNGKLLELRGKSRANNNKDDFFAKLPCVNVTFKVNGNKISRPHFLYPCKEKIEAVKQILEKENLNEEGDFIIISSGTPKKSFSKKVADFQIKTNTRIVFDRISFQEDQLVGLLKGTIRPNQGGRVYSFEIHDLTKYSLALRANKSTIFPPRYIDYNKGTLISTKKEKSSEKSRLKIDHSTTEADLANWAKLITKHGIVFNYEKSVYDENGYLIGLNGKFNGLCCYPDEFYINDLAEVQVILEVKDDYIYQPMVIQQKGANPEEFKKKLRKALMKSFNSNLENDSDFNSELLNDKLKAIDKLRLTTEAELDTSTTPILSYAEENEWNRKNWTSIPHFESHYDRLQKLYETKALQAVKFSEQEKWREKLAQLKEFRATIKKPLENHATLIPPYQELVDPIKKVHPLFKPSDKEKTKTFFINTPIIPIIEVIGRKDATLQEENKNGDGIYWGNKKLEFDKKIIIPYDFFRQNFDQSITFKMDGEWHKIKAIESVVRVPRGENPAAISDILDYYSKLKIKSSRLYQFMDSIQPNDNLYFENIETDKGLKFSMAVQFKKSAPTNGFRLKENNKFQLPNSFDDIQKVKNTNADYGFWRKNLYFDPLHIIPIKIPYSTINTYLSPPYDPFGLVQTPFSKNLDKTNKLDSVINRLFLDKAIRERKEEFFSKKEIQFPKPEKLSDSEELIDASQISILNSDEVQPLPASNFIDVPKKSWGVWDYGLSLDGNNQFSTSGINSLIDQKNGYLKVRGLEKELKNRTFFVNGIKYDQELFQKLDPTLIESINVVKGKDALALYGVEQAVLITTKTLGGKDSLSLFQMKNN